ncbi:MAG: RHS repeat domain-containing protein, partial [Lysobacteraceae bacterium]
TRVQTYGYDGLNRLTEVKDASGVVLERYTYDRTGNRQTAGAWVANDAGGGPGGGTPTFEFQTEQYSYASDSHRLLSVGGEPREYDAAGNLKRLGDPAQPGGARRMFAYNDANRMGEVSRLSGVLASYVYNGMGERVRRTVNGFDTYTLYDPDGRWLGDFNSAPTDAASVSWWLCAPIQGQSHSGPVGATLALFLSLLLAIRQDRRQDRHGGAGRCSVRQTARGSSFASPRRATFQCPEGGGHRRRRPRACPPSISFATAAAASSLAFFGIE